MNKRPYGMYSNMGKDVRVDMFIDDLFDLYEKHGLSIAHEDSQGAFIITNDNEENREWMDAAIAYL